jgi:hypothetical protein
MCLSFGGLKKLNNIGINNVVRRNNNIILKNATEPNS